MTSCPLGYVLNIDTCEPQQFKILVQGVNAIYPSGTPIRLEVIAVDLEMSDTPHLQAHGFTFDWTCLQGGVACLK